MENHGNPQTRGTDLRVVIVGGGQAGVQTADSLRGGGHTGPITIVADEAELPYQRPPLSKDFLSKDSVSRDVPAGESAAGDHPAAGTGPIPGTGPAPLPLRAASFYAEKDITLRTGTRVAGIERAGRRVALEDGTALGYDRLVLATGATNRRLACPGADLAGIHGLKTLHDAAALHRALATARNVVVIGAGFIGLEFAAAALARGCSVTVLEFAPRPMGRALSAPMGDWFAAAHAAAGVRLRLGEGIASFEAARAPASSAGSATGEAGAAPTEAGPVPTAAGIVPTHTGAGAIPGAARVAAAISTTGERYPADLVVVGIGVVPNDALAAAAGLETANGIVVDAALRTSDPAILAVGDCAIFPNAHTGAPTRLESVQNATDHARHAAASILGTAVAYAELPWFWSTQGPLRLQIAGLADPGDVPQVLGDPATGRFSVLCFRDGRLAAVESVNSPADHMAARKLLAAGAGPTPGDAAAPGFSLKAHAKAELRVPAAA